MKTFSIVAAVMLLVVLTHHWVNNNNTSSQIQTGNKKHAYIEVYVPYDILFIFPDELRIEFESGEDDVHFSSMKELSKYVGQHTARQLMILDIIPKGSYAQYRDNSDTISVITWEEGPNWSFDTVGQVISLSRGIYQDTFIYKPIK